MAMKHPIIGTIKLSVDEFISKPDSEANRIGENRIGKKHLTSLTSGAQSKVALGRYPDGRDVILDGHSRKAAWRSGTLERPENLSGDLYAISSFQDEKELIDIFCGRASVSTASEKAEQSRNRNRLEFTSDLCKSPWIAAMKTAGYPDSDEGYEVFKDALKWLDQFGLTTKNTKRTFSAGVRAAFLESFISDNKNAIVYWTDYIKDDSQIEACLIIKEELERQLGWSGSTATLYKRKTLTAIRNMGKLVNETKTSS